jgi:hypothetical protein
MLFYSHTHPSLDDSDLLYLAIATGADPGFQVWGGALKKLCRAEGGAKIFGVFRVKKIIFFPILGAGA